MENSLTSINDMDSNDSAVLFITFNRPESTKIVFEAIKKYKPNKLYIYSDGPRKDQHDTDLIKILETRKVFENTIDWECTLNTNFSEINRGCGSGPYTAINWGFETEDRLIILEDDCVPSLSFFSFCNSLLKKYAFDTRIMHISGTRWNEEFQINNRDYFFTKYAHIWGWATWKRAWMKYDFEMDDWPSFKKKQTLKYLVNDYFPLIKRWTYVFDNIYNLKNKHTWDYQWQFTIFKNNGLCINSTKNLVTNIGDDGVHTIGRTESHFRKREESEMELIEPIYFLPEFEYDEYHGKKFFLMDRSKSKVFYDIIIGKLKSIFVR